jgi:transcriptional regulator with XRE-family HTH domain
MTVTSLAWDTGAVPRRPRIPGPDERAAQRVRDERERLGLSQGELARLVTEAGVPMQQQAVWKIENGDPPRRISYGEAIAFCKVFGIEDVSELGKPREEVVNEELAVLRQKEVPQLDGAGKELLAKLHHALLRERALVSGAAEGDDIGSRLVTVMALAHFGSEVIEILQEEAPAVLEAILAREVGDNKA